MSDQDGGAPRENAYHNLEKRTGGRGGRAVKEVSQGTERFTGTKGRYAEQHPGPRKQHIF